ncbi:glycosyltransferase [Urbifossiella limnaea]|uniref:D-inositol-3-phosphate glycosyltransferase n=1 Tax=Urbifossiella limnaea TaxID=2528023 RepID=A0A517XMF1_9BACT|nr:glycosyltransferase [Urbifossiella limnaea]QDU18683.1 D-inositol-3-phosphate glycosyltransferase [Urbifossiella limnaea]
MNVSVYHEPSAPGVGGAEVVTAVIAAGLAREHRVTLHHHRPWLTSEKWAQFADADLGNVTVRVVPPPARQWHDAGGRPDRFLADLRAWQADLSRGFDLFVTSTHGVPPFNHAARGAVYVHFPTDVRGEGWPWQGGGQGPLGRVRGWVRRRLHGRAWPERFAGYQIRLANSRFTADWTAARWGVPCDVLYPPVRVDAFPDVAKRNRVAVLGRFDPMKRQLELVRAFAARAAGPLAGWELVCLGHLSDAPSERDYFATVGAAGAGAAVRLVPNPAAAELRAELAAARVFWHAAGLADPPPPPARQEHFGIATVEAMAAGCVPFVPARGGQPEIVRDGIDGYVCASVDAIADRTAAALADPAALDRRAAAARERAHEFGRDRFDAELSRRVAALAAAPAARRGA